MKKYGYVAAVMALALLALIVWRYSADSTETVVVKLSPGPAQPRVSPSEAGIDPAALEEAAVYAGERNTRALIVGRGGHIVFEKYWDGATFDTPERINGFTPVLAALAVGTALNDRLIVNLDAPLSNYLQKPPAPMTIRDALAQEGPDVDAGRNVNLVARVLEKVTGQKYDVVVAERLWKPLEGGEFSLLRAGSAESGTVWADCCLHARLGDWMRVGELLANDGKFEGNELMPPRYMTLMLTPTHKDSPHGFFMRVDGTFAAHDVAWLESAGKQRLWIVPSLKLVILRVGDEPAEDLGWDEAMIPDSIIRGTSGWQSAKVGEGVDPNKYAPH
jgi:CubicO group peptidase (beta-lactamase class C family)